MSAIWMRLFLGVVALVTITVAFADCSSEPSLASAAASLPAEERAALFQLLDRSGQDRAAFVVRTNLYDFGWRGAASYAMLHGERTRVDAAARATRETRNCVVIQGGHVRALRLARTELDDLALVAPLRRAVALDFHDARMTRIAGITGMTELDHLDLSGNHLASSHGLEGLVSLRSLYLADAGLARVEGLGGLDALEVLNVSGNDIRRIEGLADLPALRELSMARNPISTIEGLDELPALTDLDLSFCPIGRIDSLVTAPKLRFLSLWGTRVQSLLGLEDAKELTYVGVGETGSVFADPDSERIKRDYCRGRLCELF